MPTLTRWYIKSSLLYFISAIFIGIGLKTNVYSSSVFSRLTPLYYHLFMVGWVTQLIFGISHWMFPRHTREKPRGNVPMAWITFVLLNFGLLMRAVSEPLFISYPSTFWNTMLVMSSVLQWMAGLSYVVHIWKRIK